MIQKAALFLGASEASHHVPLVKRARSLGLEVVACYQCLPEDLSLTRDNLTIAAANCKFDTVIVPTVGCLAAQPVDALALVGRLLELGVQVDSLAPDESWLPKSPELIAPLVGWIRMQARAKTSQRIRRSLEKAQAVGRCGRPRKPVPPAAIAAVEAGERLAQVARRHQLGETTLRRALALHRAQQESEARKVAA